MRRAAALLAHLPPGAAIHRGTDAEWSIEAHLMANVIDMFSDADAPPLPRPGDKRRAQQRAERIASRARRHEQRQRQREGA